ncbi:hypothetical protein [Lactobacillus delbrueckii]|uniref:hypothetical protein n=1 Tax=Lactobacillus delbrueckii TaxID=1584 RepID=UPI001F42C7C3|nr:hypothetical protein [Lactobacillus delbrueckii]MDK8262139.1 hypothetical protein [Lactobacillus delbrueckii]GHN17319.1 hypothetical protein ME782_17800 [Lactobacillus delbrueckii]
MLGRTINLYLMDGDASGRWKAGISQWSGHVYKIPREYLKKSEDISELSTPGVYFLFGDDNETGQNFIYVGEADNTLKRIMQRILLNEIGVTGRMQLSMSAPMEV